MKSYLFRILLVGMVLTAGASVLRAQDTSAVRRRVALGIQYGGSARPGLIVIGAPGLDSVRHIIERDLLANSDHYEPAYTPDSTNASFLAMDVLKGIGIKWGVLLSPAPGGVHVKLYNLATGEVTQDATRPLEVRGEGDGRLAIHQVSDEIQGWTGEGKGIAATRILLKIKRGDDDRIWRIDSDGQNLVPITKGGLVYLSPTWSPDGERIAYAENTDAAWTVWIHNLRTGTRNRVQSKNNTFPAFSPDGKFLAFVHDGEKGASIAAVDVSGTICCEQNLSTTRFADNNRPAYSPDGTRIAFVTNRAGSRQIWVMDRDGSLPSPLITPEGGSGNASAPAYAPNGSAIAYVEDVPGGGQQVYVYTIANGRRAVVTSVGRNDYPSWAPDSRHLIVKSSRSGKEQLWIFDTVTGSNRQLTTPGSATFPAWSPALGATNPRS